MSGRVLSADEARGLLEGTTPAPWVNKLGPHAIPIVCGPTYDVAFTFYEDAGAGNDKADADAALLAAAPDLAATVIAQAAEVERMHRELAASRLGPRTQRGTDPRCSVEAGTSSVTYCASMAWMLDADDRHFRVGLRVPRTGEAYGAVVIDVKGKRFSFCDYCPFCGAYIATTPAEVQS